MNNTEVPYFIGKNFDQVCYVVDDLEKAMDYWTRVNGVRVWDYVEGISDRLVNKEYWGQPADFGYSCAYGACGNVMVELAVHQQGPSLYGDWLAEGQRGPHHIGFLLDDPDQYEEACEVYAGRGLVKAMAGLADGVCGWSYWDTREQVGSYTELYWTADWARERMAQFKAGEVDSLFPKS
ncbi:VOC family protein [[Mycobacterium] burgundiense]|uniref:VOC family protein n=1 Tax=[Mycobacterium] burgundiense TaxID=3064286 RepID=A0ABM9M4K7_9MYCO|nr:VOC family protein [Mycolicibacterium sp. MU0053]CAJ1510062.1 VOC family protein [Mycolicibacterium sp. MU0053]